MVTKRNRLELLGHCHVWGFVQEYLNTVISRLIKIDIPDFIFGVTELTDLRTETLGSDTTLESGTFIVFLLFRPRSDTIFSPRFWLWPAVWMLSFFDWFFLWWLCWLWSSQSCRAGTLLYLFLTLQPSPGTPHTPLQPMSPEIFFKD